MFSLTNMPPSATKHMDMSDGIHEDAKHDLGGVSNTLPQSLPLNLEDQLTTNFQPSAGEKTTGHTGAALFDSQGAIGKHFTSTSHSTHSFWLTGSANMLVAAGAIGGTAQSIGGPLDKEGMIGKQFTTAGSIGGAAQNILAGSEKNTFRDKPQ